MFPLLIIVSLSSCFVYGFSIKSEDKTQDLLTLLVQFLNVQSEKSAQRMQEQEQIMVSFLHGFPSRKVKLESL